MRSLQNLQRKNMRKNKVNIVQLCQAENRALHCSSNHRKFHWNAPGSYWDILIRPYYFGRSENAICLHFYPTESFSKTASLWAHDFILTLLQRLYHVATSYRRCNNVKITSCAHRVWYHCGFWNYIDNNTEKLKNLKIIN